MAQQFLAQFRRAFMPGLRLGLVPGLRPGLVLGFGAHRLVLLAPVFVLLFVVGGQDEGMGRKEDEGRSGSHPSRKALFLSK